jgi:hypothetical protein
VDKYQNTSSLAYNFTMIFKNVTRKRYVKHNFSGGDRRTQEGEASTASVMAAKAWRACVLDQHLA